MGTRAHASGWTLGAPVGYGLNRCFGATASAERRGEHADVAQLVEHHLAKVRVAGSNPVVRSKGFTRNTVEWPRGEATACKAVYTGSNPVSTSQHRPPGPVKLEGD